MLGSRGMFLFALVASISAVATLNPRWFEVMVYERNLWLSGEIWRLLTCHFAHYSPEHLAYDLAGFAIAMALLRGEKIEKMTVLLGWTFLLVGVAVVAIEPSMSAYGGLSGAVSGVLTYAAVQMSAEQGRGKAAGIGLLVLLAVGLFYIGGTERGLFAAFGTDGVLPSFTAHAAGIAAGLFCYCRRRVQPALG